MHGITLDHAREPFHTDTVVRTDVYATRTENTDRRVNHDIQLALETTTRLLDSLFRCITCLCLTSVAIAILQGQGRNILKRNGLVVIDHTAPVVGQFYFFRAFSRFVHAAEIAVDRAGRITPIGNRRDKVTRPFGIVTTGKEARITCHPGFTIYQRYTPFIDLNVELFGW